MPSQPVQLYQGDLKQRTDGADKACLKEFGMYTESSCASLRVRDKACFKELWVYRASSCTSLKV